MIALLVQPDQLRVDSALFRGLRPKEVLVILVENMADFTEVKFHKQRLIFVVSAMRHFAEDLRTKKYTVAHHPFCEDPIAAIRTTLTNFRIGCVRMMRSANWGVDDRYRRYVEKAGAAAAFVDSDMFVSDRLPRGFSFGPDRAVRMETFYHSIRKVTGILTKDGHPIGGRWNFDKDNRRPPVANLKIPPILRFEPDGITQAVINKVSKRFHDHFGLATPFHWPVTRAQARVLLRDFFKRRFSDFGTYQDAMIDGEDVLFHSQISSCLNVGLLEPEDVCRQAEQVHHKAQIPINSVEGFIRQVLGWREFVYQLYRANMPGYDDRNYFGAQMPLPHFFWDGRTHMRCLAEALRPVIERGLSHHIQRLMVTGNFALLAGIRPQEVNDWYWLGFIDAWHWVVTPNVIGMATFADGGLMASKPYAASANYINRMSDYCKSCPYNPKQATDKCACPFNTLYWDFLERNKPALSHNPRMSMSYRNLNRKSPAERRAIRRKAEALRSGIESGKAL